MAIITNLRRFKKRKERAEKEQAASENRVRFGQSKSAKAVTDSDVATSPVALNRKLDNHKRSRNRSPD